MTILKILRFEISSIFRSKWLFVLGCFLFGITEILLYFGNDSNQAIISLMNIVLLFIPLISIVNSLNDFYNAREFIEFLLAHPVKRSTLFLSRILGQVVPFSIIFLLSVGLPFIVHQKMSTPFLNLGILLFVGVMLICIFSVIAALIASIYKDKIKGFAYAILLWLFLSLIYDGIIESAIVVFQDYPIEKFLIACILLNPIDLGRILLLLHLNISALMGYTGAVFQTFFNTAMGMGLSITFLMLWVVLPLYLGLRIFKNKDF